MSPIRPHVGKQAAARLLSRLSTSAPRRDANESASVRLTSLQSRGVANSNLPKPRQCRTRPGVQATSTRERGVLSNPYRARYSTTAGESTDPEPEPKVHALFESETESWQYVVADPETKTGVIIDPVLNYEPGTATVGTGSADAILRLVREAGYAIALILETHAHADHLTAAGYLQHRLAGRGPGGATPAIGAGRRIEAVQARVGGVYGVAAAAYAGAFDRLFDDDETFAVGRLRVTVLPLPGHTPDHVGYRVGARDVFTGDTVFAPKRGTARCDFPGGDAAALFRSVRRRLLDKDNDDDTAAAAGSGGSGLPEDTRLWMGHDYPAADEAPVASLSVADHRRRNRHVGDRVDEPEFVAVRQARDRVLPPPRLLHQSLQWNIRAGRLPPTEGGMRMLRVPLNLADGVEPW